VDPVHGDFSFKNESSALKLGIQPLSVDIVEKMGTLRDPFLARFTPDSSMLFKSTAKEGGKKKRKKGSNELNL
jgi:hypothetical protein